MFDWSTQPDPAGAQGIPSRIKQTYLRFGPFFPDLTVSSMNGVALHVWPTRAAGCATDAGLLGSGTTTRRVTAGPQQESNLKVTS